MDPKFHALEAWEMMAAAKDALGMTRLQRIFMLGHGQIFKYCRNPRYTSDSAHTPLERVRMLIADVSEQGSEGGALARAMVDFMAEPLGMHCVPDAEGRPDKDVNGECLDDYPPVVKLHALIQDGADIRTVEAQAEEVQREVRETVVRYRMELEGE